MSPKGDPREHKFTMVLSDEEHGKLMDMASEDGISAASWARQIIRSEWLRRSQQPIPERSKEIVRARGITPRRMQNKK
jgi:hypothetical protein